MTVIHKGPRVPQILGTPHGRGYRRGPDAYLNQEESFAGRGRENFYLTRPATTLTVSVSNAGTAKLIPDQLVRLDPSDGAFVLTLPRASSPNIHLLFKNVTSSTNAVTLTANGSQLIDGAATLVLSQPYAGVELVSDASGWYAL